MVKPVFLRAAFNYDVDAASDEAGIAFDPEEGRAQQQFRDEVDINTIVRRFGLTGELPENPRIALYGDLTGLPEDYRGMVEYVRGAEEAFMEFPAEIRKRFEHDPQRMIDFVMDEKNRDEAVSLGLVSKAPEVPRDAVKAIDELAAKLVVPKAAP